MAQGPTPSQAPGHFGRLNALVENGWLAVLSGPELAVWVAYEKYAGPDGTAYPDGATLARLIGHAGKGHVGAARQSLAAYGLLRVLEVGGGRGRTWKVQMLAPGMVPVPSSPEGGDSSGTGKVPAQGQKGSPIGNLSKRERFPIGEIKVPDQGKKGSRVGNPFKDEQPSEQPSEQPKVPAAVPRGLFGDEPEVNAGVKTPGRRAALTGRREPKLTAEQQAARDAFTDWWVSTAYPGRFGVKYEFGGVAGGRNAKAVLTILGSVNVGWDLAMAKRVAEAFLGDRDPYLTNRGHKLYDLAERIERFAKPAVAGGKVNGHGTPNAHGSPSSGANARPGEFGQRVTANVVL